MDDSDTKTRFTFLLGVFIGILILGLSLKYLPENSLNRIQDLKTKCELNIPRSQKCVMEFVPQTSLSKDQPHAQ